METGRNHQQTSGTGRAVDAPPSAMYSGTWTVEETDYVTALIEEFRAGNIPGLKEKSTLRAYIAQQLGCSEKRVSKKYERSGYKGRMIYVPRPGCLTPEESKVRLAKLRKLEKQFRSSRELLLALRPANFNQPKKGGQTRSQSPTTGNIAVQNQTSQALYSSANPAVEHGNQQNLGSLEECSQKKRAASIDLPNQASRQRTNLNLNGRAHEDGLTIQQADYMALAQGNHTFQEANRLMSSLSDSRNQLSASASPGLERNVGMTNSILQLLNRTSTGGQDNGGIFQAASRLANSNRGGLQQDPGMTRRYDSAPNTATLSSNRPLQLQQDPGTMRRYDSAPSNASFSLSSSTAANPILSLWRSNSGAPSSHWGSSVRNNMTGTNENELLSLVESNASLSQSLFGASSVNHLSRELDRFRTSQMLHYHQNTNSVTPSLLPQSNRQGSTPQPRTTAAMALENYMREQAGRNSLRLRPSEEESKTNNGPLMRTRGPV